MQKKTFKKTVACTSALSLCAHNMSEHKSYYKKCVNMKQTDLLTHSREFLMCCLAFATSLAKED